MHQDERIRKVRKVRDRLSCFELVWRLKSEKGILVKGELTFSSGVFLLMRSNLNSALRKKPVGHSHSGPWW